VSALFFFFYARSDLWLDEALSVDIARVPLSDLPDALRHDGSPPLYYVLLKGWMAVFGTGDVAVRSLSGLCMAAAVVAVFFAARRLGGRQLAWLAVFVMAMNPFAVRYATEARMYALQVLLIACGIIVFQRAVERPTLSRIALFSVVVATGLYTQYWNFYILPVVVALLGWMVWRGSDRLAARRLLFATGIGILAFVPWLPIFVYQSAHTGTPWGTPILPSVPYGFTLRDFAGGATFGTEVQEGWPLFAAMFVLWLLGTFGRGIDNRRIELGLVPQKEMRAVAFFGWVGLAVALSLNYVVGGAFQTRYGSLVFPFFVLLAARGITTFCDGRVRVGIIALVVALGLAGCVRNVLTQRTQAGEIAAVLRTDARPGDLVVYCPDQVAPAVHRLAPRGLDEVVYPSAAGPARVDWVDYKARLRRADVDAFAQAALTRAGSRPLWYVRAPGYETHKNVCERLSQAFARARQQLPRTLSDPDIFEKPQLEQFDRRAGRTSEQPHVPSN
jgi:mannosyltransferase